MRLIVHVAIYLIVTTFAFALPAQAQIAEAAVAIPRSFGDSSPVRWIGRSPERYPVHGIDVARFQSSINWRAAKRAGVKFAYAKATEGGDFFDPMFRDHWKGAHRAGIPRGAYHFYYFCRTAKEQARWFIRNVPRRRGALPPVLDMEWNPFSPTCTKRPPAKEVRRQARIFLTMVGKHYGQKPIIYTTPEFYRQNDMGKLPGVEFWLRSTAKTPEHIYPGQHWTFWQYTGTGLVPGVTEEVDINVFAGTEDGWNAWLEQHQR